MGNEAQGWWCVIDTGVGWMVEEGQLRSVRLPNSAEVCPQLLSTTPVLKVAGPSELRFPVR